ncbi:hypothetical protein OG874_26030 [Nocardia sp. NBC_00565]|uniref:hypothetical protein n=1 Tax=Nocardia sp. NBC_00565 TaxID=2975993 RepID=UPI002E7FFBDE|nr:hypothetical protein [Nocardia sp. NBC_00565]WUC00350.1 hypothetical protein OG874_26030 [Nocardia sp. NBC_00565]
MGAVEHADLYSSAKSLIGILRNLTSRLVRGETHYEWHGVMADRCRSLALYLASAVADTENDAYAPALGTLRSSLEHVYLDKLIFQGTQFVQIFENVDETTWQGWERARKAGEGWEDVLHWKWSKGNVRATIKGPTTKDDAGMKQPVGIGFVYFLLGEYSPYIGPPAEQIHFDDGLTDLSVREATAGYHRQLHTTYLRWLSIKASLEADDLVDAEALRMIDVHNRFLSAFVHPNTNVTELLYGRNTWTWPTYDHYSSELILLYVNIFAVEELRSFHAMTQRAPTVEISDWDDIEQLCQQAWSLSSHMWFPGQAPHDFDRFQEANRRVFATKKAADQSSARPEDLTSTEIGYYINPLRRLIEMHAHCREYMTGFVYQSRWPRENVHLR